MGGAFDACEEKYTQDFGGETSEKVKTCKR